MFSVTNKQKGSTLYSEVHVKELNQIFLSANMSSSRRTRKAKADYSQVYVTNLEDDDIGAFSEEIPKSDTKHASSPSSSVTKGNKLVTSEKSTNASSNSKTLSSTDTNSNESKNGNQQVSGSRTADSLCPDILAITVSENGRKSKEPDTSLKSVILQKQHVLSNSSKPITLPNTTLQGQGQTKSVSQGQTKSVSQGQTNITGQGQIQIRGQTNRLNQRTRPNRNQKGFGHEEQDIVIDELD